MEAKILFKNEEDGVIYYMIKYKDSKIPVYVIPTDEELMIAKDTYEIMNQG